jgi:outer membrane receptor protein involved in Fe transport
MTSKSAGHPSRRRKLQRLPLAIAVCWALSGTALGQTEPAPPAEEQDKPAQPAQPASGTREAPTLGAVTVTAQKREEDLQDVPISVQVLSSEKLDEMSATDFDDYSKLLPSVSFDRGEGGGSVPYMRAVASGENNNHSGPQPSVGVYLDEQPLTTIGGVLDVHLYDIERVEALAGPQGTLYGASSEAGTIRIITKKPDPSGFAAGYAAELNTVSHGGDGHVAEAFINVPLHETVAFRASIWDKKDAGYIDNVLGTRTFPGIDALSGGTAGTIDNSRVARKDYNTVTTKGARAALRFDFGENWTVTPTVMSQRQKINGNFAMDPVIGDLEIQKWHPELIDDRFTQAALTVQGKIGNFDLTYAWTHLDRDIESESDYSDYAFWYDAYYNQYYADLGDPNAYGEIFVDDNGNFIDPSQRIHGEDHYQKISHELRLASPQDWRFRFLVGAFWQQQNHDILQDYQITNLAAVNSVTGWPGSYWLTNQVRHDHDEALFGEISYDITDNLTATAGMRFYSYDNDLRGFFGFGPNAWLASDYGELLCPPGGGGTPVNGGPCVNLDSKVDDHDHIGRFNLTWNIDDNKMVYVTWSEGFRPGGINRNDRAPNPPSYLADTLTNKELGWKTSWLNNRLTLNGAVFQEDWKNIQFSFIPPGGAGLTILRNAGGARIRGFEAELSWAATYNFTLTGGLALYNSKLTTDYCGFNDIDGQPVTSCPPGSIDPGDPTDPTDDEVVEVTPAPRGTRLPVTAKVKGNLVGRYVFDWMGGEGFIQGAVMHEGERRSYLTDEDNDAYGNLPAYTLVDFSAGFKRNDWSLNFYIKNAFDKRAELGRYAGCAFACILPDLVSDYPDGQRYLLTNQPRTFGVRFTKEY